MYTTLNKIQENWIGLDQWRKYFWQWDRVSVGEDQYSKLLKYLGKHKPDNEPLPITTILDSNDLGFATWCITRAVTGYEKEKTLIIAELLAGIEQWLPQELENSVDIIRRFADGLASQEDLDLVYAKSLISYNIRRSPKAFATTVFATTADTARFRAETDAMANVLRALEHNFLDVWGVWRGVIMTPLRASSRIYCCNATPFDEEQRFKQHREILKKHC